MCHFLLCLGLILQLQALWVPPLELLQMRERVQTLLPKIILPEGQIDKQNFQELVRMKESITKSVSASDPLRALYVQQLTYLIKNLPFASKILSYGYQPNLYQNIAHNMKNAKSKFAQPLLDMRYKNFMIAFDLIMGHPQDAEFDMPNPYDVTHEQMVDDYLLWAQKLENLGPYASRKALTQLAEEFMSQFDRMLTQNDLGRAKKAQLIAWIGGPDKYLGAILGRMIKQRANREHRSSSLEEVE